MKATKRELEFVESILKACRCEHLPKINITRTQIIDELRRILSEQNANGNQHEPLVMPHDDFPFGIISNNTVIAIFKNESDRDQCQGHFEELYPDVPFSAP